MRTVRRAALRLRRSGRGGFRLSRIDDVEAGAKTILTVDDHTIACGETGPDERQSLARRWHGERPDRDQPLLAYGKSVLPVRPRLHGGIGDDRASADAEPQPRIHELAGPKLVVIIG